MITKRPRHERGHANHGWLDTRHTFSFARYYDPRYAGFRDLLFINEDRVQPSRGFGTARPLSSSGAGLRQGATTWRACGGAPRSRSPDYARDPAYTFN